MIILSSAIESIPNHFSMAAQVDGASTLQRIRYVTIPMLRWPLLFVTTFQALSLLASYVEILLLTNGGPGLPTEATPWDSAMPEWKLSLTEEERWKIILAEYDLAEKTPRIPESH